MESNESVPSQKRRREDTELKRDQEVWLDDGNIVLACESTVFRVHRSILAAHCEAFKDMFAVYAPPEDEEKYEGCALIFMPDKQVDMRRFLKALIYRKSVQSYGSRQLFLIYINYSYARDITKLSLSELSSLLRLSTKYILPSLREEIVSHLSILFPKTLNDFRSPARIKLLPPDFNGITGVNLGQECDVPSILPTAYYLCSRMKAGILFHGLTFTAPDTNEPEFVKLTGNDVYYDCLRFQDHMAGKVNTLVMDTLPQRYNFCSSCNTSFCQGQVVKASIRFTSATYDILAPAPNPRPRLANTGLCIRCLESMKEVHEGLRLAIWDMLPSFCGQTSWA